MKNTTYTTKIDTRYDDEVLEYLEDCYQAPSAPGYNPATEKHSEYVGPKNEFLKQKVRNNEIIYKEDLLDALNEALNIFDVEAAAKESYKKYKERKEKVVGRLCSNIEW